MAVIETWLRQDLNRLVSVQSLQGQLFSRDDGGNLIGVKVTRDGEPVELEGTIAGYCILPDGETIDVTPATGNTGIQNGNEAYVILPQLAYSIPGQISIVIKLAHDSGVTTLAACTGYVYRSRTDDEVVPPGTPIPDLQTLETAIARANTAAAEAENVDVSTSKTGGVISISVTDRDGVTTTETLTDQSDEVANLNSALNEIWLHETYTNTAGKGGQANIYFPGKAGQTLRIVTDSVAVNLNTRATETGSNIQTQYVPPNTTFNLSITTDYDYLHLYYTANATTNFYIADAVITKALDDITNIEGDITNIEGDITNIEGDITASLMGVDVQENIYPGAANWSGTWLNSDAAHVAVSNEKYMGYPTVYSSESWRRFAKNIPVVAGKTYTFEGWIKQSVAGTVIAYLTTDGFTTDKATVSPNNKQINNVPANTWVKVTVTFVCTVSGNVSPYILGATGAFYIAKYTLVEGDTVFSLDGSLNDKATKQDVSGIGDYLKYSFSGGSAGQYFNPEIQKSVSVGTKVKLIFDSYSGSKLSYIRIDGKKSDNSYTNNLCSISSPVHGGTAEFTAIENYVALRVQYGRTETETITASIYLATTDKLGIANDLLSINSQRVFRIAKDGTGDFTSFVDGINAACQFMDSIVYVGAGTYDLLDELGTDYIKQAGVSERKGLVLKNRVHVICSSQTILSMTNLRSLYDSDEQYNNAKEYLSPINTGVYGCTLENATIIDSNVRYSIHDDKGWSGSTPYTNKFINCTLVHKSGMYGDCIGGGLGENCDIEIRGCYLEGESNVVRLAYYHGNNHTGITTAKGRVTVCDNYFAGAGTFQMTNYGDSTETSMAYVSNNSFGTAPSVSNEGTTVGMKAWNNEIRN